MMHKIIAYWRSKLANIHGLILFLGGGAGISALGFLHIPDSTARFVSGACMVLGALLYTPTGES